MSAKELVLRSGLTKLRVNDLHDRDRSIVLTIDTNDTSASSLLCTLDRSQQHFLMMYLQDRLGY